MYPQGYAYHRLKTAALHPSSLPAIKYGSFRQALKNEIDCHSFFIVHILSDTKLTISPQLSGTRIPNCIFFQRLTICASEEDRKFHFITHYTCSRHKATARLYTNYNSSKVTSFIAFIKTVMPRYFPLVLEHRTISMNDKFALKWC